MGLDIGAVQSPGLDIGALQSLFIPPTIAVSPTSGQQNQALTLTVTGTSTHFVSGTTAVAFSGTGISVGTITVASATSLTVAITVGVGAATGARTLTVTTGTEAPTTAFTVLLGLSQRGNIDFDQIRIAARQGTGSKLQMFGGGSVVTSHVLVYDATGNAVDGGALPTAYVLPLATASVLGGVKIGANVTVAGDGTISVAAPGAGTVTSVGLAMPSEFTVSSSPVTGAGTLTVAKANQSANLVYAGPASGAAAQPAFRGLVQADMPAGIAPQVNSDWNASSGVAHILNQPPLTSDGTAITPSTGNMSITSSLSTATTVAIANTSASARTYLLQAGGSGSGNTLGWLTIADQATGNFICGFRGDISTRKIIKLPASTVMGWTADETMAGPDVGLQRTSAGVLMVSDTNANPMGLQTGNQTWYSPDKSRSLQISCANGATPIIASSVGNVQFSSGVTVAGALNTSGNIAVNSGSILYVYNAANTQSLTISFAATPTFASTNNTMSFNSNTLFAPVSAGSGFLINLAAVASGNTFLTIQCPTQSNIGMNIGVSNNINNGYQPYLFSGTQLNISAPVLYVTGSVSATAHNTHASGHGIADVHKHFRRIGTGRGASGAVEHQIPNSSWGLVPSPQGLHIVVKREDGEVREFILPWEQSLPVN